MRIATKLVLSFGTLSVLSVLLVGGLVNFLFDRHFQDYVGRGRQQRLAAIAQSLAAVYAESGGWPAASARVNSGCRLDPDDITVLDTAGRQVIAPAQPGPGPGRGRTRFQIPIVVDGQQVGTALVGLGGPGRGMSTVDADFRAQINGSIFRAGVASALVILFACWLLARGMGERLRRLEQSAERLGAGDLATRTGLGGGDEVGHVGRAFDTMAERLQEAEQVRAQLTADVAHELRTPLAAVRGYLEGMQDGVIAGDAPTLAACHRETMRLVALVDDLQTLAAADAEGLQPRLEPVDLRRALDEAIAAVGPAFPDSQIRLSLPDDGVDCTLPLDPELLQRAVRNLIVNACKYSPAGAPVSVGLTCDATRATITVADQGDGIAPEDLPHIFDRFYRADPSRARATGGSGLGLTIARSLARLLGGDITAASEPGHGAVFTLWFARPPRS